MKATHMVLAIVRQRDQILLVSQPNFWTMPGGLVEIGEPLLAAVVRETWEEGGVHITNVGPLAFLTQIERPKERFFCYAFETLGWEPAQQFADPDGEVTGQEWVSIPVALERLGRLPWPGMREPQLAYLNGTAPAGRVWNYIEKELPDDQHCMGWV